MDQRRIIFETDTVSAATSGLPVHLLEPDSRHRLRLSLERLSSNYLTRQSPYSRLRMFLPAPVLALVWFLTSWFPGGVDYRTLLGTSVTLRHLLLAAEIAILWNVCLYLSPSSTRNAWSTLKQETWLLVRASAVCGLMFYVAERLERGSTQGVGLGVGVAVVFVLFSFALLLVFFCLSTDLFHKASKPRLALIIGTGRRAAGLRKLIERNHAPLDVVGCLDEEYLGCNEREDKYLGRLDQLADLLKTQPIELVLIGLPVKSMYEQIQNVIAVCESVGVESHYMSDIFATAVATHQPAIHSPGFTVLATITDDPRQAIKRALDFFVASLILILAAPVMLAIAVAIKITSPGPVFFIQQRFGRHRKQFPMFKFRTMVVDAEKLQAELEARNEAQGPVFKLKKDPRISGIGHILRKTSLDELPQLFNVIRGEMSLVGPRPLPLRDVSRFEEAWLLRRFSVRPGLTCLWQVGGRSNTTFDEWIKLDLEYIDNWSLSLDLSILGQTVPAVIRGSGAM